MSSAIFREKWESLGVGDSVTHEEFPGALFKVVGKEISSKYPAEIGFAKVLCVPMIHSRQSREATHLVENGLLRFRQIQKIHRITPFNPYSDPDWV